MYKMIVLAQKPGASQLHEIETIFSTGTFDTLQLLLWNALREVNPFMDASIVRIVGKDLETGEAFTIYEHYSTGRPPFGGKYKVGGRNVNLCDSYLNYYFQLVITPTEYKAVYSDEPTGTRGVDITGQCEAVLEAAYINMQTSPLVKASVINYYDLAGNKASGF